MNNTTALTSGSGSGPVADFSSTPTFYSGGTINGYSATPYSGSHCAVTDKAYPIHLSSSFDQPYTVEYVFKPVSTGPYALFSNVGASSCAVNLGEDGISTLAPYYTKNDLYSSVENSYFQYYAAVTSPAIPFGQWSRAIITGTSFHLCLSIYKGANIMGTVPDLSACYYMPTNPVGDPGFIPRALGTYISSAITDASSKMLIDSIAIAPGFWQGSVLDPNGRGGISQKTEANVWAIANDVAAPPSNVVADSHWGIDLEGGAI